MWRVGSRAKGETLGEWPGSDRPRVLIEEADGATQWAMQKVLERAGYDVALCGGPARLVGHKCPLVADGSCALVEGADVIVNGLSPASADNRAVVTALQATHPEIPVVIGLPAREVAQHAALLDDCELMPYPATTAGVLSRVRRGLSRRHHPSSV